MRFLVHLAMPKLGIFVIFLSDFLMVFDDIGSGCILIDLIAKDVAYFSMSYPVE